MIPLELKNLFGQMRLDKAILEVWNPTFVQRVHPWEESDSSLLKKDPPV